MEGGVLEALIEILVMVTFDTHHYLWEDKVKKQAKGGPIGCRVIGSVAKITMPISTAEFHLCSDIARTDVKILWSYVDDIFTAAINLKLSEIYSENSKKIEHSDVSENYHKIRVRVRTRSPWILY